MEDGGITTVNVALWIIFPFIYQITASANIIKMQVESGFSFRCGFRLPWFHTSAARDAREDLKTGRQLHALPEPRHPAAHVSGIVNRIPQYFYEFVCLSFLRRKYILPAAQR